MRSSERATAVASIVDDARTVDGGYLKAVRHVADLKGVGYGSGSNDGPRSSDVSDPTAAAVLSSVTAVRPRGGAWDTWAADQLEFDQRLARARTDLEWMTKFVRRHTEFFGIVNLEGDEVCASHARLSLYAPPRVLKPNIEGVPRKPLCRRCEDFAREYHCWPPEEIVVKFDQGKVFDRDIREALAAEKAS